MKKLLLLCIFSLFTFVSSRAQCENQCSYIFVLSDTFGDGWNGNTVNVVQNGQVVATLGNDFNDGHGPFTATVTLCDEQPFELYGNEGGSFQSEVELNVIAASGQTIFMVGGGQYNSGLLYQGVTDCSEIGCITPFNLTATETAGFNAQLSWSGLSDQYEILVQSANANTPTETTSGTPVTGNTYLATNLSVNDDLIFYVRAVCGESGFSAWSPGYFFTVYCSPPGNVSVSAINAQGATFTWQGNADSYEVMVFPASETPSETATGTVVTGNTFTADGLLENVSYIFYTRTLCNETQSTNWIPFLFTPMSPPVPIVTNSALYTPEQLVTTVLMGNPCLEISNVTSSTGTNFGATHNGIGFFTNTSELFPLSSGLVLSTGDVSSIPGPNDETLSDGGDAWSGDTQLEAIISAVIGEPMNSHNASILEFDFTSTNEFMSFNFLFASDEYGTYQCEYADAFAFLLTDVATGITTNLAVVPGTTDPVSVVTIRNETHNESCTSVNPGYFDAYFDPNTNNASPTNFNGQTEVMTASSALIPNHLYHIKLVIADRTDDIFDSAVFIQAGSFTSGPPQCSDKVELVAFVDENANGVKDAGEVPFTYGAFSVSLNDAAATSVFSPFGQHTIYDANATNSYDFNYLLNAEYSSFYSFTGLAYPDVSIATGSGTQTLYFPVTLTTPYVDVTVSIVPQIPPRPGFAYSNKVEYKNLGVANANGTVTFVKDPLTTITGMPAGAVATTDGFTYAFSDLQPYESRSFTVNLLAADAPDVQVDDLLTTQATITAANDLQASNNYFVNTEIVVASYDPNIITEAHGHEIAINTFTADNYLYYTIRFQNTGTAHAINVRVEQELDTMIDAESLRLMGASHGYWMERIGNKLIWHFDYIQLPGQLESEELSKGYAMYRVKLNPGFEVGDIVPAVADIYFDNNEPVVTPTFETEFVAPLSTHDITASELVLYPNPANNSFTVGFTAGGTIERVRLFDVLGKNIMTTEAAGQSLLNVDITPLSNGVYFVEVITADKQRMTRKLVVE